MTGADSLSFFIRCSSWNVLGNASRSQTLLDLVFLSARRPEKWPELARVWGRGCSPNEGVSLGVNNSVDLNRTVRASVHEWSCRPAQQMALADRSSAYIQMKGR